MIESIKLNARAMSVLEKEQRDKLRANLDFAQELLKQRCEEMGAPFSS